MSTTTAAAAKLARENQVCGTRPLHDGEYLRRTLHQRADAKRDRDHLRIQAQLISGDAEQRGPPAHGQDTRFFLP